MEHMVRSCGPLKHPGQLMAQRVFRQTGGSLTHLLYVLTSLHDPKDRLFFFLNLSTRLLQSSFAKVAA